MDLLATISSPGIQQKYLNEFKRQIIASLKETRDYNANTQPRCKLIDEVLAACVSSNISLARNCCELLTELVDGGFIERKFACSQLQSTVSYVIDSDSIAGSNTSSSVSTLCKLLVHPDSPTYSLLAPTHPLILLLNENPHLSSQMLSTLEANDLWLKHLNKLKPFILYTMLRPEWPMEHSMFRQRLNLLLKGESSCCKLISHYTEWLPRSTQFLEVGQLLVINLSEPTVDHMIILLSYFQDVFSKDYDFTFILDAVNRIVNALPPDTKNHSSTTVILAVLLVSTPVCYARSLLSISQSLFKKGALPHCKMLIPAIMHSAIATESSTKDLISSLRGSPSSTESVESSLNLRLLCSEVLAGCQLLDEPTSPVALPRGVSNQILSIIVSYKVITVPSDQLHGWLSHLLTQAEADADCSCIYFHALTIRLNTEVRPKLVLEIMKAMPRIASSKVTAALVRNLLVFMSQAPQLYPIALTLLSKLYSTHQSLCFPALLTVLLSHGDSNRPFESSLAKALTIKHVIENSPNLHGTDVVAPLSQLMSSSTSEEFSPVVVVCLDSVKLLCDAGVLNFKSFLEKKGPEFIQTSRPHVKAAFWRLCSILPESNLSEGELLRYRKALFRDFFNEQANSVVRSSALITLASFKRLTLASLPDEFVTSLDLPGDHSMDDAIPVSTLLLMYNSCSSSPNLANGYINFLSALIREEVAELPRSAIVTKAQRSSTRNDIHQATLAQIPRLQQSFFHQATEEFKSNVAAGLLLTYNPPVKRDENGVALKTSLVQHSNSFRTMLRSLLEAAPVFHPKDWFMSLTCLQQWNALISRAFESLTNGRKAEKENNEEATLRASLWARDELFVMLNETESPICLVGLCALINTIYEFNQGLKLKDKLLMDQNRNYITHADWPRRAFTALVQFIKGTPIEDSYFTLFFANFTRTARLTQLSRSASLLSLHSLLTVIQSQNRLSEILSMFLEEIPTDPQQIFLVSLGAGLLIQKISARGLIEVSSNLKTITQQIVTKYRNIAFERTETRPCNEFVYGLTFALSGLCSNKEFSQPTQSVCASLIRLLRETSPTNEDYGCIAMCSALLVSNACNFVLSEASLSDLAAWLSQNRSDFQQNEGIAVALGVVLYSMSVQEVLKQSTDRKGHRLVEALVSKIWLPVVANLQEGTANKLAAVKGIAALIGACNHLLIQYKDAQWEVSSVFSRELSTSLLDSLIKDINSSKQDQTLKSSNIWIMGLLHKCLSADVEDVPLYPTSLHHLGKESLLAEMISNFKDRSTWELVRCLDQTFSSPLPCFSWGSALRPLLFSPYRSHVIRFAIQNIPHTPSLLPLLEAVISPTIIQSSDESTMDLLLDNVLVFLDYCNVARLGALAAVFREKRLCSEQQPVSEKAWESFAKFLTEKSSSHPSVSLLHETVLQSLSKTSARFSMMACLFKMGDFTLRELLLNSIEDNEPQWKAVQVKMLLAGVLEAQHVGNLFVFAEQMGSNPFAQFLKECQAVNCDIAVAENSAKWLLEILPTDSISQRQLSVLSLLAYLSFTDGCTSNYSESQLVQLLPYHLEQMTATKIWGQTAVEKLLEWLLNLSNAMDKKSPEFASIYHSLYTLRHNQAFKMIKIWARAVDIL